MFHTSLIFATNNHHKAEEIRHVLGNRFTIKTLKEAGIDIDIPEPHNTLEENAREKSSVIHKLTGYNCFSEDTGLEVPALKGEPGVKSARYAGEDANFKNNINKLLTNMKGVTQRDAQFRTVISLVLEEKEFLFEGTCTGRITEAERGNNGFGYDPVFIPDGAEKTFAEMSIEEKTIYSHRKKATEKFIHFLNQYNGKDQN
jgi:XTP/dITP diphosphohydrolase